MMKSEERVAMEKEIMTDTAVKLAIGAKTELQVLKIFSKDFEYLAGLTELADKLSAELADKIKEFKK